MRGQPRKLEALRRSRTHRSHGLDAAISRMLGYGGRKPADQAPAHAGSGSRGTPEQYRKARRLSRDHQPERGRPLAVRIEDPARPKGPRYPRHRHAVRHGSARRPSPRRAVDKEGKVWYTDFGEMFTASSTRSRSSSSNIRSRSSRTKRRPACSPSSSITRARSGSTRCIKAPLGRLDPGRQIAYYPCRRNGNDDNRAAQLHGLAPRR